MPREVKRRYDSSRRREQATATRFQILEAAERLWSRDGYVGTSVAAVAAAAGVTARTVYLGFGSKSGLLRALWNHRLRGDSGERPVGERTWFLAVIDEPDPERALRLNVRNAKLVRRRVGRLLDVIRDAAVSDAEVAELWARIQREFYDNQHAVVEALQRRRALRPGLGVMRATDLLWTLNHPDVYRLLVGERGWTPDQHERWLADILCSQLLALDARVRG
jgi:AcrR family transcriptional regulator